MTRETDFRLAPSIREHLVQDAFADVMGWKHNSAKVNALVALADLGHPQALDEAEKLVRLDEREYESPIRIHTRWQQEYDMARVAGAIARHRTYEDAMALALEIEDSDPQTRAFLLIGKEGFNEALEKAARDAYFMVPTTRKDYLTEIADYLAAKGDLEELLKLQPQIAPDHRGLGTKVFNRILIECAFNAQNAEYMHALIDVISAIDPSEAIDLLVDLAKRGDGLAKEKAFQLCMEQGMRVRAIEIADITVDIK